MVFFIAMLFCVSMLSASEENSKKIKHLKLYTQLYQIIQDDCQPLKRDGKFVYPHLLTHLDVMGAIKDVNGGLLPISHDAKERIVYALWAAYPYEHAEAHKFFRKYAKFYSLHKLSRDKTLLLLSNQYTFYGNHYNNDQQNKAESFFTSLSDDALDDIV